MIITSIEELRLCAPTHALDTIDSLVGFIDNSEHEFLEDKLGTPLYEHLCKWYDEHPMARSSVADYNVDAMNRLLLMCQRVVAFDALGRASGMQTVSVNNAGINQMAAQDYAAADEKAVETYRQTCVKEAHSALNQLLKTLERWTRDGGKDYKKIVELWQKSQYYYLAAALLLPSCAVLQDYLNIYDSREKFIQMLPDLNFIQEEIIAPAIGEDLMKALIDFTRDGKLPEPEPEPNEGEANPLKPLFAKLVHRLRKSMTAILEGRTQVLKVSKERKIAAHDDGVRMLGNVVDYLRQHQQEFPEALVKNAPWFVPPVPADDSGDVPPQGNDNKGGCPCDEPHKNAACWTPPLL